MAEPGENEDRVPTYYSADPGSYGSLKRVLPPDYPTAALEAGLSGSVVVTGTLLPDGLLDATSFEPDRRESAVFVDALREVVPYWEFRVPVGNDCMPSTKPFSVKVDFEVRDGKPHTYVTHAPGTPAAAEPLRELKPLSAPKLTYPWSMVHSGAEAVVFARQDVDADGNVIDVVAQVYSHHDTSGLQPFAREAREKLRLWRYPPEPGVPVRHLCYDIIYRFR